MRSHSKTNTAKSFRDLRRLLTETEEGMENHVYSKLARGDVWSIPDQVTGFGEKDKHPWVVVRNYKRGSSFVEISPRTTKFKRGDDGKQGIITPAGIIPELNKEGLILLKHRVKLTVEEFRDYVYLGRLPDQWIQRLQDFHRKPIKNLGKQNGRK